MAKRLCVGRHWPVFRFPFPVSCFSFASALAQRRALNGVATLDPRPASALVPRLPLLPDDDRGALRWLIVSGLLCLAIFLATVPLPRVDRHLIGSDGFAYYAIVRSVALDRDFDFANDYALLGIGHHRRKAPTGMPVNPFAIGTAILWLPFFLVAHAAALGLAALGLRMGSDGVGYLYEAAVCCGTIFYASVGFMLTYRTARRLFQVRVALLATLAMWWATGAIYYVVAEPSMSHGPAIFAEALFLWLWYPPDRSRTPGRWFVLGLAVALVALVRWQEGLIVAVPAAELLLALRERRRRADLLARGTAFGAGAVAGFLPQIVMWSAVYGTPLTIPQGNDFIHWLQPHPWLMLFSSRHGLMSWHPIFLLATLGLLPLWRRDRALALVVGAMFVAQLYVNSAVGRWWADDAFGARRFIGLVPLFTLSLAALMATTSRRIERSAWLSVLLLLVIWNGLSFAQYRLGFISMNAALTWRQMTIDRLLLPWRLLRRLLS